MKNQEEVWMVFYTVSRHEKRADEMLRQAGFISYLPLIEVVKKWSDRMKKLMEPLFKGYIFVKISRSKIGAVSEVFGIVGPVRIGTEYAILTEKEIKIIRLTEKSGYPIEHVDIDLSEGDDVQLIAGPMKGIRGKYITKASGSYLFIMIEGLNTGFKVRVQKYLIKPISSKKQANNDLGLASLILFLGLGITNMLT
jgi:transcription antitermination factor NusG